MHEESVAIYTSMHKYNIYNKLQFKILFPGFLLLFNRPFVLLYCGLLLCHFSILNWNMFYDPDTGLTGSSKIPFVNKYVVLKFSKGFGLTNVHIT